MNIFSSDPVDRDAARVRVEFAAMQSAADTARQEEGATLSGNTQAGNTDAGPNRTGRDRADTMGVWSSRVLRLAHGLGAMWREQIEAQERLAILRRPWTHNTAHWHEQADGSVVLHGEDVPPNDRSIPVTAGGWCPSSAREVGVLGGHAPLQAHRERQR